MAANDRLPVAAYIGDSEEVERLLECKGINVNRPYSNGGATPLYIAAQQGHERVVEVILKHEDIQVNDRNKLGGTPLYIAAQGSYSIMRVTSESPTQVRLDTMW